MDETSVLVGIVLAILVLAIGYGLYQTTFDRAGSAIDSSNSSLEGKTGVTEDDKWPIDYRCEKECFRVDKEWVAKEF